MFHNELMFITKHYVNCVHACTQITIIYMDSIGSLHTQVLICTLCFYTGIALSLSLTASNPTPCFNETVVLTCDYPDVKEEDGNKYHSRPQWKKNRTEFNPGTDIFYRNMTAEQLMVRPDNFISGPVQYTCALLLTRGEEYAVNITLDPEG